MGTWNVEYARGADRNALRLSELVRREADVWVLTETHDDLDLAPAYKAIRSQPRPGKPVRARWVTIWTRWPLLDQLPVEDPLRTVAARLLAPHGEVIVFGTVLPWHSDRGDTPSVPPPLNWEEHHRVIPLQGAEWAGLRAAHPAAELRIIGDLNTGITGGYGTRQGRALLAQAMAEACLTCPTADALDQDGLPLIDHVLLSDWTSSVGLAVDAWSGGGRRTSGRLSDHPGVLVATSLLGPAGER